jgi:RNA polymerase sigma-70 factor (ECF subfamily)
MRSPRDQRLRDLENLYEDRHSHFVRIARAVTGSRELAHDVVQDAFATAVRERDQYREEGPLEAWVWRIVINKARLKAHEQVTLPLDVVCRPDSNGSRDDVVAAVAALPERQRLVVFLRYYADLDYRSIAETLTIEVGTVSATLHQAHAALRRSLSEVENEL